MNRTIMQLFGWLVASLLVAASPAINAAEEEGPQATVNAATTTLKDFIADPDLTWFRDHVGEAKALVIIPSYVKAGFIFGGAGGKGVLVAKNKKGHWSGPVFVTMGAGSFGLQAGVEVAQVVLLVLTEKGLDALLSTNAKLGADLSASVGPKGAGAGAATADVLTFTRAKGLFAGVSLSGAVVSPSEGNNEAYYGKKVSPVDILITHQVSNPQAKGLLAEVRKAAGIK